MYFYEFIPTIITLIIVLILIILTRCFIQPVDDKVIKGGIT